MFEIVKKHFILGIVWSAILVGVFCLGLFVFGKWHDEWSGYNASTKIGDGYCRIAVIHIKGDISFFADNEEDGANVVDADDVVAKIHQAESEQGILGILVRIDSLGGAPVASRVISDALRRSPLPVAAVIREYGTSGGYLIASGADHIFADPMSDVGSIGVTMSYVDNVEKNRKEGLGFVSLSSAKYKDYGNPDRSLTGEERALIERDLKNAHDEFVRAVAENRKLSVEDISKLADGSSMPGTLALEHKLIDTLGDQESARIWFARELKIPAEEIEYCQ